ncbi:MAG: sialate O-acetylesterase [Clostridium sp.]|nr:sialate O-acetylesterase [Clostridium sp.]
MISFRHFLAASLVVAAATLAPAAAEVPVFVVAGQSNSDGRIPTIDLPYYADFSLCNYSYADGQTFRNGQFETYTPYTHVSGDSERFGYDAFVYHYIGQATGRPFYVIKETLGGTAIDPSCSNSNNGHFWSCDPEWLASQTAASAGGHSLIKSLERSFRACVENTLSKIDEGYDVKAILWHQGESDRSGQGPQNYYDNLSALISHMRRFIAETTGNDEYLRLPFIMGTVPTASAQYVAEVEEAQRRIADEDDNVWLVDMADQPLQKDNLHFDATTGEYMATQVFRRLVDLGIVPETDLWLDKEVTELLVNPDFEIARDGSLHTDASTPDRGIPYGWESVGELLGNSFGINNDAVNLHGHNTCWINSSPMPSFYELSQTIPAASLTPGEYEVRCKIYIEENKKADARLFANNSVMYYGREDDYTNLLTDGEEVTYGGFAGRKNGDHYLHTLHVRVAVAEGEDLKIGIRTSGRTNAGDNRSDNNGWFKVDEFRLFRLSEATTDALDDIRADDVQTFPAGVYDLTGRALPTNANLPSGFYIVNGRKVLR